MHLDSVRTVMVYFVMKQLKLQKQTYHNSNVKITEMDIDDKQTAYC